MRDYAKVSPQFWIGETGKQLRAAGPEAQIVSLYLLSSPHSNMIGLYYLPRLFLEHETGLDRKGASKGLQRASEALFCYYDDASEVVWVVQMAAYQVGEALQPADNRVKGIQKEYDNLPENPFLEAFFDHYAGAFHLRNKRVCKKPLASPLQAPCKPLRSQEQEQEQEQEINICPADDGVTDVFEFWKSEFDHPRAVLDEGRRKVIRKALKGYSVDDLKRALAGYKNSPHHMGQNDRQTVYDDIQLLLRDAKHIDAGLKFAGATRWQ